MGVQKNCVKTLDFWFYSLPDQFARNWISSLQNDYTAYGR